MVVAFISLTVAVSGVAWAAAMIGADDIQKNAVRSKHIKVQQVKTKHLKRNAVKAGKIASGTPGVALAGVNVAADGTVDSFFNRLGGAPRVNNIGNGIYVVSFPGITLNVNDFVHLATPQGASRRFIRVRDSATPRAVDVRIQAHGGAFVNEKFYYAVFGTR
jgi:hypothetical protein